MCPLHSSKISKSNFRLHLMPDLTFYIDDELQPKIPSCIIREQRRSISYPIFEIKPITHTICWRKHFYGSLNQVITIRGHHRNAINNTRNYHIFWLVRNRNHFSNVQSEICLIEIIAVDFSGEIRPVFFNED